MATCRMVGAYEVSMLAQTCITRKESSMMYLHVVQYDPWCLKEIVAKLLRIHSLSMPVVRICTTGRSLSSTLAWIAEFLCNFFLARALEPNDRQGLKVLQNNSKQATCMLPASQNFCLAALLTNGLLFTGAAVRTDSAGDQRKPDQPWLLWWVRSTSSILPNACRSRESSVIELYIQQGLHGSAAKHLMVAGVSRTIEFSKLNQRQIDNTNHRFYQPIFTGFGRFLCKPNFIKAGSPRSSSPCSLACRTSASVEEWRQYNRYLRYQKASQEKNVKISWHRYHLSVLFVDRCLPDATLTINWAIRQFSLDIQT